MAEAVVKNRSRFEFGAVFGEKWKEIICSKSEIIWIHVLTLYIHTSIPWFKIPTQSCVCTANLDR